MSVSLWYNYQFKVKGGGGTTIIIVCVEPLGWNSSTLMMYGTEEKESTKQISGFFRPN